MKLFGFGKNGEKTKPPEPDYAAIAKDVLDGIETQRQEQNAIEIDSYVTTHPKEDRVDLRQAFQVAGTRLQSFDPKDPITSNQGRDMQVDHAKKTLGEKRQQEKLAQNGQAKSEPSHNSR